MDIKLPELGEGIESGDVINVLVSEGDVVAKDQGLIELETDKASVEIPSTHAGRVAKIHVKAGDVLRVGGTIVSLEAESGADEASPPAKPQAETNGEKREDAAPTVEPPPAPEPPTPAPSPQPSPSPGPVTQPAPPTPPEPPGPQQDAPRATPAAAAAEGNDEVIPAGPAMRRFAREVGVDLRRVEGSGEGGRITRADVLRVVRQGAASTATQTTPPPLAESHAAAEPQAAPPAGEPGRDDWGPIRVEKLSKIRQTIAAKMHESWTTIPRVTNFDDADVTELEQVRQASKADYASAGIRLTQMPFVIKACAMALRGNPVVNASIDLESGEVIYKEYVNIGIAVDTERGLIVPALRDADRLSIPDIARSLEALAEKVRGGKFGVDDLRGSTFTISNLGAIGGTFSTPIINPPEVAILLIGRSRKSPVVVDHQFAVRLMMPLSLSYDHRLVDGAAAARFLNDVKGFLQAPSRLLLAP